MKLACIIPTLNGGGAERVMAKLCSELSRRDHDVTLITLDDGQQDRHQTEPSVQRLYLDVMGDPSSQSAFQRSFLSKGLRAMSRISKIRQAIRKMHPDLILSFCDQMNVMTLIAASRLEIPTIVCERSDPRHQALPSPWEWLRGATYPKAIKVITLTEEVGDYLAQRCNADVAVIASAIDPPELDSQRELAQRACTILAMGRLEKEKGFERLIECFSESAHKNPDWKLCIVGEGSRREALEERVRTLGLKGRVELPGWVVDPWNHHSNATFFVLPSHYEGFPSVLMEAMSRGIPALTVDCDSGPRAIVRTSSTHSGKRTAYLIPNDHDALREGVGKMIEDTTFRESVGLNAKCVTECYNWTTMVDQYEEIIRLACG